VRRRSADALALPPRTKSAGLAPRARLWASLTPWRGKRTARPPAREAPPRGPHSRTSAGGFGLGAELLGAIFPNGSAANLAVIFTQVFATAHRGGAPETCPRNKRNGYIALFIVLRPRPKIAHVTGLAARA
jgi:hypothetical protein